MVQNSGEILRCFTTNNHVGNTMRHNDIPVRKGISSARVRSTPSAKAIVDSFLIEFKRSCGC